MFSRTLLAGCLFVAAGHANAFSIIVDSDLNDWLAAAPTGTSAADWTPLDGQGIKYFVEDQTGSNGFLDPGWGGQPYDAEAIYVQRSSTHINIAVVTGRAPGAGGYAAGDIAIDFGLDGVFDYGVVTLGDSTGIGSAGDLFDVSAWNYGLWTAPGVQGDATTTPFGLAHPTTVNSGNKLGAVALSYSAFEYNGTTGLGLGEYGDAGQHYVIETSIALSLLDPTMSSEAFLVHWTMACANDFVEVDPPGALPSPTSLLLVLAGILGVGARRRQARVRCLRPRPAVRDSRPPEAGPPAA